MGKRDIEIGGQNLKMASSKSLRKGQIIAGIRGKLKRYHGEKNRKKPLTKPRKS